MIKPLCPYFGVCGGCRYQDLAYEEELALKEGNLRTLLRKTLPLADPVFQPIVASPQPYHYRSRLDLSFRKRRGEMSLGFMSEGTRRLVAVESCSIARPEISEFLPALKKLASEKLPENYKSANLVVKTGDEGTIRWGGIGRRSLRLSEADYFWTEIEGKKIFYSLDTFFQANLGILPTVIKTLRSLLGLTPETRLLDLYAGVGLFWVVFASEVRKVWAVEESGSAIRAAEFNRSHHGFSNVTLVGGRTEERLDEVLSEADGQSLAGIVDPPRKGLTPLALQRLTGAGRINPLVYISCNPPALARDLEGFVKAGWRVDRVIPFDFFPRTQHLETLVRLLPD